MDKRRSEKDQKALFTALERAKEIRLKMEFKEAEKRWSEIKVPLTLADSLARLTKYDLSTIRTNLGVHGASTLKKQELISALEQHVPDVLPQLLNKFDETRYKIIKKIADRGGHDYLPLETHQLHYFNDRGILFSGTYRGKRTLAIPQEILECFKNIDSTSYRETVRRNTEWIKLTQGMLFYYGHLNIDELIALVQSHTGKNVMMSDFITVLRESLPFYESIRLDANGFSDFRVRDVKLLKKDRQSRPDLSVYPFTKAQLMLAGEPDFVDRNPSYKAFVQFIRNHYTVSMEEAGFIVEDCVEAIQNEEPPGEVLRSLQSQMEIDDLDMMKAFMDHIVMLHNNTRQWSIKGYTPNELSATKNRTNTVPLAVKADVIDLATRKKIGRNDPCPCGSGRKFKKCCGG
jgi:uncharacterized protein YchJ/ribosomal silencing factor RsfS